MIALECYYSLSSPWAYFGGPQLQDIVRRHRVRLTLKPYDFQAVVPQTGGIPLKTRPEPRRTYHALELARWRDHLGMPLNLEPAHYPKGVPRDIHWNKYAGWMVIAAQLQGLDAQPLSHALLRAQRRGDGKRGVRLTDLRPRWRALLGSGPARFPRSRAGPAAGRARRVKAGLARGPSR